MRKICSHCGSILPPGKIECPICGTCIDSNTNMSEYIDKNMRLYCDNLRWTKYAAIALFVLAAAELVTAIIFSKEYYVYLPLIGIVPAIISGLSFLFPVQAFQIDQIYFQRGRIYSDYEIDHPSPSSLNLMFISLAVASAISLGAFLYFLIFRESFLIPPPIDINDLINGEWSYETGSKIM